MGGITSSMAVKFPSPYLDSPLHKKDSLMEMSFHIPNSITQFIGDETRPSAQVFREKIMTMADAGPSGKFRSCQDGYAVKLKAEDGILYPLEKGFFFLPKPPTLILYDEIEYVEFERLGAGGSSMSSCYFDLLVKLKNEQEHLFRYICRNEYHNLLDFISGKGLEIMDLGSMQTTNGVAS